LPPGSSRIDMLTPEFARFLRAKPVMLGDVIAERYRLVESLGDGAMGQVFVADNLAIGRRVALKVLRSELLADAQFRKRFQKEAEAIAHIEHRNVVRFFDIIVGDPTVLVMEYVPGPTLSKVLKDSGRLQPQRALTIARRLAFALEAAHTAGVIHRDIKPANVILSRDPELGEDPKLIDFGLAKLTLATEEALTRTGQVVGTPAYMAPEQIANRPVDARADVYALGCLLFHMLAGRPPFESDDDVAVLYGHMNTPPPRLGALCTVPPTVELLVTRALMKDPDDRYASMRDFAQALGSLSGFTGQHAAVPAPGATVAQILLVAGLALLVGAGGAFAWVRRSQPAAAPAAGGQILITSKPSNATVEIDGVKLRDPTPAVALDLAPGTHKVRVARGGSTAVEQTVMIDKPGDRFAVDVALAPASHGVEVTTVPAGAVAYLDGHMVNGQTPLTIQLVDDDFHELRIEKIGFANVVESFKPDDKREALSLQLQPEKVPRGSLYVDSKASAQVWLDGGDTGLITPTLAIRIDAGDHTVELRDGAGGVGPARKIHIDKGQTVHLELEAPMPKGK
jgi:serine/threonine-protein kinase